MLRYTVKILYELCLKNFLNLTKPSLLALHGSIAPCPGVHAGTFLIFIWHNSTVSRQLRYSLSRHLPCATTRNANSPQHKERKPRVPRAHTYSRRRYAAWLRYCTKLCLIGFLCLTKPSKRAVRGAVLLAPASMQGRFCVLWA